MENNRLTRILSTILVFMALAGLTVVILRPVQKGFFVKMTALRDELIAQGETFLGMKIKYSAMGPSLFSVLDVRDVGIYGSAEDPLVSLARARISFSLWGLLQGRGAGALRSIRLDSPEVSLDLDRAGELKTLLAKIREPEDRVPGPAPADEGAGNWLAGFSGDMSLIIRGGGGALITGGNRFSFSGFNLEASIQGTVISLRGKADGTAFLAAFLDQPLSLGMSGRISGKLDTRLREGTLALAVPSVAGDRFSFRPLQFDVALDTEKIEIQKNGERGPWASSSWDLSLGYNFNARYFFGRFEGRDLTPRFFLSLSGPWEQYAPILGLSVNGAASFEASARDGVSYTLDLSGELGKIFPIDGVSYAVTAAGDGERAYFRRLSLGFPQGEIGYTGSVEFATPSLNGGVTIRDFSLAPAPNSADSGGGSGGDLINADLRVISSGRSVALFGNDVSMGPVLFTALDADIQWKDQGAAFDVSVLRFAGADDYGEGRIRSFSVEGSLDYEPRHLQASLIFDTFSVDDILGMFRPLAITPPLPGLASPIAADTSITAEIFVTTDFEQIQYNAPRIVLAYQGEGRSFFAVASVSGTNRRFELNESRVVLSGGAAEASGYVDFHNPNDIAFSLAGSYQDMYYQFEGAVLDQRSLSVQGSYGLAAYITRSPSGGYSGYIEAGSIPILLNGQFSRVNFLSSLRYDSPESWFLDLNRLEINELATPASPSASLRLSGRADQEGLTFYNIIFDDGRGVLFGNADVSWHSALEGERTAVTVSLHVEDPQGQEFYNLEGIYEDGVVDVSVTGQEMQLGRVSSAIPSALANGEGRLHWTIGGSYEATAVLSSLIARYNDAFVSLSAEASLTEDDLTIRNLQMSYGDIKAELPLFRLDRQDAEVRLQGQIQGIALGRKIDGSFTAEADFQPFTGWRTLGEALNSFSGSFAVDRIRIDALELAEPFRVVFFRNESLISLSGGPQDMMRFRITREGAFYAGISSPSPIRGAVTGTIADNMIDARASNLYVDLTALGRLLPRKEVVALTGGMVNGSIDIRGSVGDPEFFGTAQGNSVRLEIPQYMGAELGPAPINVVLDGNEMHFGPIIVPAGTGYGEVSGWFRFDRWIPNTFSIDITVLPEYSVPFDFEILGVVAHGGASGFLNVFVEDSRLHLLGNILGEDTEIILDAQGINAAMNQSMTDITGVITDFTLTTGRKVEFFWPTAEYPLLQASAAAGTVVKITSDSETSRFSINGDIDIRSGSLFYGQRSFYIREGTLSFNENEIQFDPRLTVRAETRDRIDDEPVTISLIVDNAPLRSFTPRFEASPPLSQVEILSLLGQNLTGLPAEGGEGVGVQNIVFSGVDFLSQSVVFRPLERIIRNVTGLDMFSFRFPIAQNFIASQWIPIDNERRGNYFDNTAVFFGKYVSSDMFVQGSVLLQYDENNLEMGGYTFEADLGIELRSPLFDIRWNVSPLNYQTFFDASFTLTWRWLF
ncbi:MAG: translocation/assembly module TamB domain-containing protein [Spirochaetaceae bacterium]|jgi:hypothetical protein|nr:translocation/assembly module TamB domain-containing protein [Spirochaetaceae bacterium]